MLWDIPTCIAKRFGDRRGVSVLEVTIVLGIVAVTALVVGETFLGGMRTTQLADVRRNLATELRIARQWAVIRREAIAVTFMVGGSQVSTHRYRVTGRPLRRYDFSKKGIVVKSLSKGARVVFYASGRTATPTTIRLQGRRGSQTALTVSVTGRVRKK